jgi:hypothetical protein
MTQHEVQNEWPHESRQKVLPLGWTQTEQTGAVAPLLERKLRCWRRSFCIELLPSPLLGSMHDSTSSAWLSAWYLSVTSVIAHL